MEKVEALLLRLSTDDRAEIRAAADSLGESMTTFLTQAALTRARQIKKRPPARGVHRGVPGFFRACCSEAAVGGNGYVGAGLHLAGSLGSASPYDDLNEWEIEVEKLRQLLIDDDVRGVWSWFKQHFPRCMELVPARRRDQFVAGARQAWEDTNLDL
jgi:Protein of unknown function (DUF1778)